MMISCRMNRSTKCSPFAGLQQLALAMAALVFTSFIACSTLILSSASVSVSAARLPPHESSTSARGTAHNPSVIIVGAGMSGIMAARTLAKHGIEDFMILEATEKIGGRIRNTNFSGLSVELGANWVEGVGGKERNPIWTLAKQYDLRTFYSNYDNVTSNFYDEKGHLIPSSIVEPRYELLQASVDFTNNLSASLHKNKESDISILTSQRLFGQVPASPLDMAIDYFNYDYEAAEPPRITSLKNVLPRPTFHDYGEDVYLVADKRGYVHVVHQLAKDFLKYQDEDLVDTRVKFNKVVNFIEYTSNGATVKTEDGIVYNTSHVILSVSLGVLQSNLIDYKPDLPFWKLETIFKFNMAVYTKIFLKFPYTFWPTGPGTEFFIYADDKRGYYSLWQHLETEYPGSNVLFVTVTDDESRRIEQQSDKETKQEIMVILHKMFGPNIPKIEDILVPRWWKNRFFLGTFTNWPIGASEEDFDRMKAPIGRLYFTGEHTDEKFNGYVHGAYFAGISTANSVIDCLKHKKCDEMTTSAVSWDHLKGKSSQEDDLTKTCKGACCTARQEEREALRQAYIHGMQSLEEALAKKCKP